MRSSWETPLLTVVIRRYFKCKRLRYVQLHLSPKILYKKGELQRDFMQIFLGVMFTELRRVHLIHRQKMPLTYRQILRPSVLTCRLREITRRKIFDVFLGVIQDLLQTTSVCKSCSLFSKALQSVWNIGKNQSVGVGRIKGEKITNQ